MIRSPPQYNHIDRRRLHPIPSCRVARRILSQADKPRLPCLPSRLAGLLARRILPGACATLLEASMRVPWSGFWPAPIRQKPSPGNAVDQITGDGLPGRTQGRGRPPCSRFRISKREARLPRSSGLRRIARMGQSTAVHGADRDTCDTSRVPWMHCNCSGRSHTRLCRNCLR